MMKWAERKGQTCPKSLCWKTMEELGIGIPVWLTSDQRKEDPLLKLRLEGMYAPGLEEPWAAQGKGRRSGHLV